MAEPEQKQPADPATLETAIKELQQTMLAIETSLAGDNNSTPS